MEIVETEKNYLEALNSVISVSQNAFQFINPFQFDALGLKIKFVLPFQPKFFEGW